MSSAHCKSVGNSISILPVTGIAVLGSILTTMSPVVLTKAGENVTEQDLNPSAVNVMIELEDPPGEVKSLPIQALKVCVVMAGLGFKMLETWMKMLLTKVSVMMAFEITTV